MIIFWKTHDSQAHARRHGLQALVVYISIYVVLTNWVLRGCIGHFNGFIFLPHFDKFLEIDGVVSVKFDLGLVLASFSEHHLT